MGWARRVVDRACTHWTTGSGRRATDPARSEGTVNGLRKPYATAAGRLKRTRVPRGGVRQPDPAAVGLDDRPGDRQPEAGALARSRRVGAAAVERGEHPRAVRRGRCRSPVSATSISTPGADGSARTTTLPSAGVWRIAFWMRLNSTRWSFSGLAWAGIEVAGQRRRSRRRPSPRPARAWPRSSPRPARGAATCCSDHVMSPASSRESSNRSSIRALSASMWVLIRSR